jgi:cell division protein FtsB
MAVMFELRRRARHVVGPVVGTLLLGYFAYHAFEGDRGLLAMRDLDRRIVEAEATLDILAGERDYLDRRVAMLHPNSLDRDLLEERARVLLNLAHGDDIAVSPAGAFADKIEVARHGTLR